MNLHHVGYAVGEIEPTASSYCKRFGYQACTPIIHDPLQTAYVQFFRLPGDQTYLEFVAPDGPNSKLSNAVARQITLNHLCFAVDDIEKATEDLRKTGMAVMSRPVPAVAFAGRRISWLMGRDSVPIELVERGSPLAP
jgi:methylmalonyl-CoA/ethylmalonyl-CoA epimerase